MRQQNQRQVSFDDEKLILVNEQDEVLGYKDKLDCHLGEGVLHRAFSIFIFNEKGEVLMQQRSGEKMLWPQYW
ncbi:MAG: isopentenyl-diphosphate delta-isomerase, partial [Calditrichia bacterium]